MRSKMPSPSPAERLAGHMQDPNFLENWKASHDAFYRKHGRPGLVPFRGVPTYFRACCMESAAGHQHGTRIEGGYSHAGWHLAIHLGDHADDYENADEWAARAALLRAALDARDVAAVWQWFKDEYPRCVVLVPTRRKETFVAGVLQAFGDGRIEL